MTPLRSNCYVIHASGHAVIIDPGAPEAKLIDWIKTSKVIVDAILLTHGHFDHIGGVMTVKELTNAPVYVSKSDEAWLLDPSLSRLDILVLADAYVKEGDIIETETCSFQVIETPGHSKGGVCYLVDDILFSGDTLFYQSIGRTDIPEADPKVIYKSVKKLYDMLADHVVVYPGHARQTTIGHERHHNPFVRG